MKTLFDRALNRAKSVLRPACGVPHAYSQEGEDLVLARIFENQARGFYVDVGAHHPIRFSNTYNAYLRGWNGINIDPYIGMAAEFNALRPRDTNLELGIGKSAGSLKYFIFNESALNTFDPTLAAERDGLASYRLIDTQEVPIKPLSEVLKKYLPPSQRIDFLTVDAEGADLDVLKSNDWSMFQPLVVLVEDISATSIELSMASPITRYMVEAGYEFFAKTVYTMFFKRKKPVV